MQIRMKGHAARVLYSVGGGLSPGCARSVQSGGGEFFTMIFTGGHLGGVPALTYFMDKRKELERR